MLTGRRPFVGRGVHPAAPQRLNQTAPDPSALVRGLDRGWDQLVARCLARDPARRFARVEDIVAAGTGAAVPLVAAARHRASWRARPRWRWCCWACWRRSRWPAAGWSCGRPRVAAAGPAAGRPAPARLPPGPAACGAGSRPAAARRTWWPSLDAGRFCIDRFEASVVDDVQERPLSPLYPPWGPLARAVHRDWSERAGRGPRGPQRHGAAAHPPLPRWRGAGCRGRCPGRA